MKKYIIIAVVVVLAIFLLFGGRSAEKTAEEFLTAMHEADAKKMVSLMCDELIESANADSKKVLIKQLEDSLENSMEKIRDEYGEKVTCNVEIIDVYKYTPSLNSTFEGEEMLEAAYSITYKGKGLFKKDEGQTDGELQLVKRGHKWFVADF